MNKLGAHKLRLIASMGLLAAALPMTGCVQPAPYRPPPPAYGPPPPSPEVVTYAAPPPPRVEYQPPPPSPDPFWVWAPGHWRWNGAAYVWHHGIWKRRPNAHVIWYAPHWVPRGNGWVFVEGRFG